MWRSLVYTSLGACKSMAISHSISHREFLKLAGIGTAGFASTNYLNTNFNRLPKFAKI